MPLLLKREIPDDDATPMREAAEREGKCLEDWAVMLLRRSAPRPSEFYDAVVRLLKHTVQEKQR